MKAAQAVLDSVDARDFFLTGSDIRNVRSQYVDCLWKRAAREVESVFLWVRCPPLTSHIFNQRACIITEELCHAASE